MFIIACKNVVQIRFFFKSIHSECSEQIFSENGWGSVVKYGLFENAVFWYIYGTMHNNV